MTDPTEAIRKAHAAFAAFPSATTLSALHLACKPSALGALLDRLDGAERDAGRYRWTLHHLGLIESHAMQWRPSKHKPLMDYLQDFIEASLRAGEQKEPQ